MKRRLSAFWTITLVIFILGLASFPVRCVAQSAIQVDANGVPVTVGGVVRHSDLTVDQTTKRLRVDVGSAAITGTVNTSTNVSSVIVGRTNAVPWAIDTDGSGKVSLSGVGTNSVIGFEVACTNAFTLQYSTTALTNGQVLAHGIVTNFFRTVGGQTTLQSCAVTIPGTNQWIPLCVHYYSRSTEGATASFTNGIAYVYAPTADDLLYHARAVHLVATNISVGWLQGVPFNTSVTNYFVHEPEYNLGTPIVNRNADQNLYYVVVADVGCNLTNGPPVTGYGFRLRTTGFQDQ